MAQVGRAADDGADYVAQIGTAKYQTLSEAIAAAPTDGTATTITLLADVTGASTTANTPDFTIPKSATITLDLNNHTVTGSGWGSVFLSEGNFTIEDNSSAKGGTITGGYAKGWNAETGKFYTKDDVGTRTDIMNITSVSVGGAVNVQAGKLTVNGGTFKGNYAYQGGAIYVVDAENFAKYNALELIDIANPVTATLNSCTITGNCTYQQAGGVGAYPYAHLIINDGALISDNSTYAEGGGVVVARTSVVTMNGGVVRGNKAHHGGGVYATGFFTMNGGLIEQNYAEYCTTRVLTGAQNIYGAGLCIAGLYDKFGKAVLKGGTVKNNIFVPTTQADMYYGAGVFVTNDAPVSLYDGFEVADKNIVENDVKTLNDIQVRGGGYFILEDDLTHDMLVSVAFGCGLLVDSNGHAYGSHISTDADQLSVVDGKLYGLPNTSAADAVCQIRVSDAYMYFPTIEAGFALMGSATDHTLTLLKDITDFSQANIPYGENTIDLNGHTIKASATANEAQNGYMYMFTAMSQVENKSTLTIKNGTIDGNQRIGCLKLNGYCTATASNVTFTNDYQNATTGGAIWVTNNSDVTFDNCTWTDNYAGFTSGAVYIAPNCTSVFNKCTLTGNTAKANGGAVRNDANTYVTFIDCTFDNNKADTGNGGAVYNLGGVIDIKGGTFNGNYAAAYGGAVYSGAKVAIHDGSFTGNTAGGGWGTICMGGASEQFDIYGGTITGDATREGSALYISGNAVARIMGGNISGGLYKYGSTCKISVLAGKFDTEANTGTATTTTSGRFKVSDFLSPYSTLADNKDDDAKAYPYVWRLPTPSCLLTASRTLTPWP